jgi:hypothetical protein
MLTLKQFHSQLAEGTLAGARHIRISDALTEFPQALYALADSLEILDLSGNQLSQLPADLPRFKKLRILFASNNPFTELPAVLGQMPELEMVGFKACQIAHVPGQSLPPRLRWLILTDNRLKALPESIGQCARLQKLMLSCNQLQQLPESLVQCQRLELLRIASNRFEQLPELIFALPQLAWLAMAGNPITQKSELLALDENGIEAISYQNLQLGEKLGEGASGHIYRASHAGHDLALKVFKAAHTSDGTPQSELAAGLAAGSHPNLLTPLGPVCGLPEQQLAMALPLLPTAMQALAQSPVLIAAHAMSTALSSAFHRRPPSTCCKACKALSPTCMRAACCMATCMRTTSSGMRQRAKPCSATLAPPPCCNHCPESRWRSCSRLNCVRCAIWKMEIQARLA